jgi:CyaY protein
MWRQVKALNAITTIFPPNTPGAVSHGVFPPRQREPIMDEPEFNARADTMLAHIEQLIEACAPDVDLELKAGGVLELEFESGSKIIINRHSAAREIWLAAKSGGYHFKPDSSDPLLWVAARDGAELVSVLERCMVEQADVDIKLTRASR